MQNNFLVNSIATKPGTGVISSKRGSRTKLLRPSCWKQSLSLNRFNRGKIGCQRKIAAAIELGSRTASRFGARHQLLGNQSAKHHVLSFTNGSLTTATAKVR